MESQTLAGRAAIVTGAGGAIGSAIASRLAKAGADVAIVDRDFTFTAQWGGHASASEIAALVTAAGQRVVVAEGDAADRSFVESVVARAERAFDRVDVLVNCAGGALTPAEDSFASTISDADLELLFAANYRSTVNFCQSAVPRMRAQGSGSVVNITSGVGHLVPRDGSLAHYLAAKAAVTSYTVSLANEIGQYGIRVNAVSPGLVMGPRTAAQAADRGAGREEARERVALRRFGDPDDIAKVVEFFAGDLSSYVTGQLLAVTGG
ncbi:3-oxoacyl-[acyl-carrier-protein] reductase [Nocardioides humi]|uniref:3-oxoacyl-[acyl-carrier-protein] reductase n=2 Tax=Nocardioides humi TaxID=449461 RepID=A0ABN2ABT3_9ACTN